MLCHAFDSIDMTLHPDSRVFSAGPRNLKDSRLSSCEKLSDVAALLIKFIRMRESSN